MSLSIEQIENGQTQHAGNADKAKPATGEAFAALLANLSLESRTFSGVSPDLALPAAATRSATGENDRPPQETDADFDTYTADNGAARADEPTAAPRSMDDRERTRPDDTGKGEDRGPRLTDADDAPVGEPGRSAGADDGAPETAPAPANAAGTAQAGEPQVAAAARGGPTPQAAAAQAGTPQQGQEVFKDMAGGRPLAAPNEPIRPDAARPVTGSDAAPLKAVVADQGSKMASQPNASLAASATVNAQLGRGAKPAAQSPDDGMLPLEEGFVLRGQIQSPNAAAKPMTADAAKAAGQPGQDGAMTDTAGKSGSGNQTAPAMTVQPAAAVTAAPLGTASTLGNAAQAGQPAAGQAADATLTTTASTSQAQAPARSSPASFSAAMRNAGQPLPTAEQVAIQIQRAVGNGSDRITIQLRPQELGRVEVKMEVGHDGKLLAVISADKPETLDLLQRDQRSLQNALSDAGLDVDNDSLSFNLNGQEDDPALASDGDDGMPGGDDAGLVPDDEAATGSGHVNVITEDKVDVLL